MIELCFDLVLLTCTTASNIQVPVEFLEFHIFYSSILNTFPSKMSLNITKNVCVCVCVCVSSLAS